jgi:hypothetical protein
MYVHDFTDITRPKIFGRVSHPLEAMGGIPWHTIYPVEAGPSHPRLQNLVIGCSSRSKRIAASRGTPATSST